MPGVLAVFSGPCGAKCVELVDHISEFSFKFSFLFESLVELFLTKISIKIAFE